MIKKTRPFIKWVGGKSTALPYLKKSAYFDLQDYKYCEPFLGSGALFFSLQPKQATLCDINKNLILTYQSIQQHSDDVISELHDHRDHHAEAYYYKKRSEYNEATDPVKIAGLFIYLNKTCYNGLYRVNSKGEFNVPFGKHVSPTIFDEANIRNVASLLGNVQLHSRSFEETPVQADCFYYFDPPYFKTFDQYHKESFSLELHTRLASLCREIDKKGGKFMLTNSNTSEIRELYKYFASGQVVEVRKSVSCKPSGRVKEKELIITNYLA